MASSFDYGSGPVANINVTPLVDVMLVLLVIFMVTAPMLQQGVEVNLPKTKTGDLTGDEEQVVISIDKAGEVYIGSKNKVALIDLAEKVKIILAAKKSEGDKVYIKADEVVNYGLVMKVMGSLYQGGVTEVGMVTDLPDAPTE